MPNVADVNPQMQSCWWYDAYWQDGVKKHHINYICQWRNFRNMSRVAPEAILRPDARRDVIESEGARGTYCGNCGIAYVVLFTDWRTIFRSSRYLMGYFETFLGVAVCNVVVVGYGWCTRWWWGSFTVKYCLNTSLRVVWIIIQIS